MLTVEQSKTVEQKILLPTSMNYVSIANINQSNPD